MSQIYNWYLSCECISRSTSLPQSTNKQTNSLTVIFLTSQIQCKDRKHVFSVFSLVFELLYVVHPCNRCNPVKSLHRALIIITGRISSTYSMCILIQYVHEIKNIFVCSAMQLPCQAGMLQCPRSALCNKSCVLRRDSRDKLHDDNMDRKDEACSLYCCSSQHKRQSFC